MTPIDLLRRELSRNGARPLLTWYDDSAGARIELSVATTANWVAKIAGFLTDEHDLGPGDRVTVELPLHWQAPCALLAVWACGAAVCLDSSGEVTIGTSPSSDLVVGTDPMGVELSRLVGAQPDDFAPLVPVDGSALALRAEGRQWTHDELGAAASRSAAHHAIGSTSRVLTTMGFDSVDGIDAGLLVPLAAGASIVLVTNADPSRLAERRAAEQVTDTFLR
ncbi:MAG TPA: TIGR03089 family protein [Mycobacteriales bacterium]|nr:TIGR03089 family protein [Mycobacteriales bacterium]